MSTTPRGDRDRIYYEKNREKIAEKKREYQARTRDKHAVRMRRYQGKESTKARKAAYAREYHYGLTADDVNAMLVAQGGSCAVCSTHLERFDVDHDHATGKVRGLVCRRCNIRLGALEDPAFMVEGPAYLLRHASVSRN